MTPSLRDVSPPGPLARLAARALKASLLVDRAAGLFDRFRSRLVCLLASDQVLDAYNTIAYGAGSRYQPAADGDHAEWFSWERAAVETWFPKAPAKVLIGGAGGGREARQLLKLGYQVIAFEPVAALAGGLAAQRWQGLQVFEGRYETLPDLTEIDGGRAPRLEDLGPFDAAIMGWGSLAHVRRADDRVSAIRSLVAVVSGPILLSVYPPLWSPTPGRAFSQWLYGEGAVFSPGLGRVQTFTDAQFRELLSDAQVEVLACDPQSRPDNWPHAIVRRQTGV
jgi:hypothetical protein